MYQIPQKNSTNTDVNSKVNPLIDIQLNQPSPQAEIAAVTTTSSFSSATTQLFKGVTALCGLTVLGGAAYWLSSWLGGGGNSSKDKSVDSAELKSLTSEFTQNSKSIPNTVSVHPAITSPDERGDQEESLLPANAELGELSSSHRLTTRSMITKSSAEGENNVLSTADSNNENKDTNKDQVFSTDDLEYRDKTVGLNLQTQQQKLLGAGSDTTECHYLASVDLGNIGNGWGVKLNGEVAGDESGYSVSAAGDINGDGIDDLVIGALYADPYGRVSAGISYVVFGKNTAWTSPLELSSLNGVNGFKIYGEASYGYSGMSISSAKDINSDGISDLVIGAYRISPPGRPEAGGGYVVFGKNTTWTSPFELSSLNGTNGFKIYGEVTGDFCGSSVNFAGDINGDGIEDLVIGAYSANPYGRTEAGSSYVVFGKNTNWTSPLELSSLNGINGFKINGEAANDWSGLSVSGAGDINGDGIADLVVGAHYASPPGRSMAGVSYLVFGKNTTWTSPLELSSLNGVYGFKIYGEVANDRSGISASAAGDVNGDGIADLVIGAYTASPAGRSMAGASYVVFGKNTTWTSPFELSSLNGMNGFKINGEVAGDFSSYFVGKIGDFNSDGTADLVIGAPYADPPGRIGAGVSYVVFGKKAWTSPLELLGLNGENGFKINGEVTVDQSGHCAAGDINGDGIEDLVIGAPDADPSGRSSAGASYVVFGGCQSRLVNNTLTVYRGETAIISNAVLATNNQSPNIIFKINNIQHGNFSLTSQSSIPIYNFTAAQVAASTIQFTHDGSINQPSYQVIVNDGLSETTPQDAIVEFITGFILINNRLMINQGQMILVTNTSLCATATDSDPNQLFFLISDIHHGRFALISNLTTEVTSFVQEAITNSTVYFIHDNTQIKPSYKISVSDGLITTSPKDAIVTFDAMPSVVRNNFNFGQGQLTTITPNMLNATDIDSDVASLEFIISNTQHGNFSLSSNQDLSIYHFTQKQIAAQNISFIHDGLANAPSFEISVSDGVLTTTPVAAAIHFGFAPILINRQLTINQGQTVAITNTSLSATIVDSDPHALLFLISDIQHGHFSLTQNLTAEVTNFVQGAIANNTVVFIHDNTQIKPSYKISVRSDLVTVGPEDAIVTFDAMPILVKNNFNFGQGQLTTITPNMLKATDIDSDVASLEFIISNTQHGNFSLSSNHELPIDHFTQRQIAAQNISFIHDGLANAPSFEISVSDGTITTLPVAAVIQFNFAPILTRNQMTIGQGLTVILNEALLNATDIDTDHASLSFTATAINHGKFALVSDPGNEIQQFTQGQVTKQQIRFAHDNTLLAPSYMISVNDSSIVSKPQNSTVVFDLAPILVNNHLIIGQGQEVFLTSSMLSATDADNEPSTLLFTGNHLQNGQFVLAANTSKTITKFTQGQVVNNQIKFIHDGTIVSPTYEISVDDGIVTTSPSETVVTFYKAPVLTARSLTVYQGQTVIISNATLDAVVDTDANSLEFSVSDLQHGKFSLVSDPTAAITYFSKQQIASGALQFTHDNSPNAPSCMVSAHNSYVASTSVPLLVTFDAAPVLGANQLTIGNGETVVFTSAMLNASDPDSNVAELIFHIDNIQHGQFEVGLVCSNMTLTFKQQEITTGRVSFIHDGSLLAPSYRVAVNDSLLTTAFQPALITFLSHPESASSSNGLRDIVISAAIAGSIVTGLLLFKKYNDVKNNKEFSGKDMQNLVCLTLLQRIKVTGCLDYMNAQTIFDLKCAVNELFDTLFSLGCNINIDSLTFLEQQKLANQIVHQIEKTLLPKRNCCYSMARFFKDWCVAELIPDQITTHAAAIANAIKMDLAKNHLFENAVELAKTNLVVPTPKDMLENTGVTLPSATFLSANSIYSTSSGSTSPSSVNMQQHKLMSVDTKFIEQKSQL